MTVANYRKLIAYGIGALLMLANQMWGIELFGITETTDIGAVETNTSVKHIVDLIILAGTGIGVWGARNTPSGG